MLMAVFNLGDDRYALDCSQVEAIIPQTERHALPQAPPYIAGVFSYFGTLVPVIDMCQLTLGRPCKNYYSTRTILVRYPIAAGRTRLLGLLAENVTEMIDSSPEAVSSPGIAAQDTDYLDGMLGDEKGLVACVRIEGLLTEEVRAILFTDEANINQAAINAGEQQ